LHNCIKTRGAKKKTPKITQKSAVVNSSGVSWNFVQGEGCSTNSFVDRGQREQGSGGGSPLVRGSRGSCNLVKEI